MVLHGLCAAGSPPEPGVPSPGCSSRIGGSATPAVPTYSCATSTKAAHAEDAVRPPRRLVGWIISRPAELPDHGRRHLDELLGSCPALTVLTEHVRAFADLLNARRRAGLEAWMSAVLRTFVRGLRRDGGLGRLDPALPRLVLRQVDARPGRY